MSFTTMTKTDTLPVRLGRYSLAAVLASAQEYVVDQGPLRLFYLEHAESWADLHRNRHLPLPYLKTSVLRKRPARQRRKFCGADVIHTMAGFKGLTQSKRNLQAKRIGAFDINHISNLVARKAASNSFGWFPTRFGPVLACATRMKSENSHHSHAAVTPC
jgi:hypothetical protein